MSAEYKNIIIIDNQSDYQPLIEYYEEIGNTIKIHFMEGNYGHRVFWNNKDLYNRYSKGYYVVTDADVVPGIDCPHDFLLKFKQLLDKNNDVTKVGFSLNIEDLPHTNPEREHIIERQKVFWHKMKSGHYDADIDTTFALYRPHNPFSDRISFFKAIRTAKPYVAIHGGWYINPKKLTEEQEHYLATSNLSGSWKIDEKGNLVNKKFL